MHIMRSNSKFFKPFILFLAFGVFFISCLQFNSKKHPKDIDFSKLPFKKLSEYGLFKGEISELIENDDVLLYEPISTLFTDYAFKKRMVWMPKGSSANFDYKKPDQALDLPEHSILVKNFYYPADFRKPEAEKQLVETRLLIKVKGKWEAYSYKWNKDQTEADYKITGGIIDVDWKNEKGEKKAIKYAMPNKSQCKSCHTSNGKMMPIGPKLKQLNYTMTYADVRENQLDRWARIGYLKSIPEKIKIQKLVSINDASASLDLKARSYLDVNCGHCHSATGPAATSGLKLNIEENDPYHWGVGKSPVAAGMGAGTFKYDILAGKSKESIITYRMNSTHPGVMMPELGRVSIHKEGVELIMKWIDDLK